MDSNDFAHVVYDENFGCWFADWPDQENRFLSKQWLPCYQRACEEAKARGLKGVIVYIPPEDVE